jgi:pimeloyl-ACP methyl ester carboxylesterase
MLVPNGMEIVAIDFIGHGKSEHLPPQAEPLFLNYVTQVFDVASALGWDRFHLMGHSMGAAVASMVAGLMPAAVESVVLVEALGPLSSNAKAVVVLEEALRDRYKYLKRQPKVWPSVEDCVKKLRSNNPDIAEHSAKAIVKRGTINVQGGVSFCHDPRLVGKSLIRLKEDEVIGYLERIRCPVLLVWTKGTLATMRKQEKKRKEEQKEADPGVSREALSEDESRNSRVPSALEVMENRMKSVRNLELLLVDGYHHVHIDSPDNIYQQVLKFLVKPKPKL